MTNLPSWIRIHSPGTYIKNRELQILGIKVFFRTDNLIETGPLLTGFVRAAEGQGVNLAVIVHESRALTEDKEKLAQLIIPSSSPASSSSQPELSS